MGILLELYPGAASTPQPRTDKEWQERNAELERENAELKATLEMITGMGNKRLSQMNHPSMYDAQEG